MLKKLRLEKFMSVDNATLELDKINIFIGPTDSGKSTLMRAIDAVVTNKFPASTYASHGSTKYAIAIVTDLGVVQLIKSKSTQFQTIMLVDGKQQRREFNAAGKDVPAEVKQILNMPYLPISDTEVLDVLYQSQHKPFFLITENRDVFSKVIALISNADKLRSLEKLVNSDILINKRNVTQLKEAIADYDRTIALREVEVDTLSKYKDLTSKYQTISDSIAMTQVRITKLTSLIALNSEIDILTAQSEVQKISIDNVSGSIDRFSILSSLSLAFSDSQKVVPLKVDSPDFLNFSLQELQSSHLSASMQIPEQVSIPEFGFDKIDALKQALFESRAQIPESVLVENFDFSKFSEVRSQLSVLFSVQSELSALADVKAQVDSELQQLVGTVCPVCGNTIDVEHLKEFTNV